MSALVQKPHPVQLWGHCPGHGCVDPLCLHRVGTAALRSAVSDLGTLRADQIDAAESASTALSMLDDCCEQQHSWRAHQKPIFASGHCQLRKYHVCGDTDLFALSLADAGADTGAAAAFHANAEALPLILGSYWESPHDYFQITNLIHVSGHGLQWQPYWYHADVSFCTISACATNVDDVWHSLLTPGACYEQPAHAQWQRSLQIAAGADFQKQHGEDFVGAAIFAAHLADGVFAAAVAHASVPAPTPAAVVVAAAFHVDYHGANGSILRVG